MRRMSGVLVVSMMLLLFTSCSDDSSDAGDPPTSSPPTSSSPTPTTSTPPEDETPEEFIRRWIDEDTRMQNTGETDAYLAMTWHCEGCQSLADRVQRIYRKGGFISTKGLEVRSMQRHDGKPVTFTVHTEGSPTVYRDSATSRKKRLPGGPLGLVLQLARRHGEWRVTVSLVSAE